MMNSASISADIVSYTSLGEGDKRSIEIKVKKLLSTLSKKYKDENFYGRMVQGDYIECAIQSPKYALRIALLLKTFIKSLELEKTKQNTVRLKYFKEHGIRLAVAVAPLVTINAKQGIIDGEAIYLSGRTIKSLSTSNKEKIVIKSSMYFRSPDPMKQETFDVIFSLLDDIISKFTARQSEVIYHKLLGKNEKEIQKILGLKSQSTISQHSTAGGWHAIEKTVSYFEKNIS